MTVKLVRLYRRIGVDLVSNEKLFLFTLILVALTVRILTTFLLQTYEFASDREMGYEMGYLAHSLATTGEFAFDGKPSAQISPLYPALLSIPFMVFGSYTVSAAITAFVM